MLTVLECIILANIKSTINTHTCAAISFSSMNRYQDDAMKRNLPEMCKGFLNKRYCVLQDVFIRSKISSKLVIIYNGHASDKICTP